MVFYKSTARFIQFSSPCASACTKKSATARTLGERRTSSCMTRCRGLSCTSGVGACRATGTRHRPRSRSRRAAGQCPGPGQCFAGSAQSHCRPGPRACRPGQRPPSGSRRLAWTGSAPAIARAAKLPPQSMQTGARYSDGTHALQAALAGQGVALLGLPLLREELRLNLLEVVCEPHLPGHTTSAPPPNARPALPRWR